MKNDKEKEKEKNTRLEQSRNGKNTPGGTRSYGVVQDLEEHLRPDWWRRIFNSIYLKTDADVVDDRNITSNEINRYVEILGLKSDDPVLDVCCGQGRHYMELSRLGFTALEGLDRSHYLIQKARAQARKENLPSRFKEGDARKLPYQPDNFEVVLILGNSFGYFETAQDDLRVLREVFRVLRPWGRLLIDVTDGEYMRDNFQPRSWEWINKKMFVCRERSLSRDGQRLISREVVTHVEKGVIADQFYAERLYTAKSIENLLNEAGFSNFTLHGLMSPDSQRNQDLGMMEKRLIVTAQCKKEWSPRRKRKETARSVVVVMGDPTKSDPIKPKSTFDEDDFYTIDQMKAALHELGEYNFSFLSRHETLIHDLATQKPKIDFIFNLCDEGYDNDARKELHVPALLEILGIPYTGGGPQCLGMCYDKSMVRGVAKEMGIPVPEAFFVKPEDIVYELPLAFPVIVKPNFGDSSFGITQRSIGQNEEQLVNAITEIREKFGYEKPILVEEFLTGKDISVGIIGNPPESYTVLPIIEEDYSSLPPELPRICGYEAKWMPDSPYWNIRSVPAHLPEETEKNVVEWCLRLFERLECRDYARFDWRLDSSGSPRLLEVNPNPGWCWDGHLAKMAKYMDLGYRDMLAAILRAAEQRIESARRIAEPPTVPAPSGVS